MGSSFAAGPGLGPDQGRGCLSSTDNYAHLVATKARLKLIDVTCSGAVTANLSTVRQGANSPQVAAVTVGTRLVTITAGGNDLGYSSDTLVCMAAAKAGKPCELPAVKETTAKAAALEQALTRLLARIQSIAPRASVFLIAYPRVLPDPPTTCSDNVIGPADTAALAGIGTVLNDTLRQSAKTAGVQFLDAYSASPTQGVCAAAGERWIVGSDAVVAPAFNYHPTVLGMEGVARLVNVELDAKG